MWWALSLAFCVIGIFTAVMLRWLYSPGFVNFHVMFNVWFSWTMALAFVALVPIDLNLVYVERCLGLFDGNITLAGEECPMEYWRTWNAVENIADDSAALQRSQEAVRISWLLVYSVCVGNGWFILTAQQNFEENRQFNLYRKTMESLGNNGCFWVIVSTLFSVLVIFLALLGQDQEYVLFGLMALGNTICLLVVALLLGLGMVEFPRALFQNGRIAYTIRKSQGQAIEENSAFQDAANDMAKLMCKVYALRRAASNTLRHLGGKIMVMVRECPFDVASTVLMDPVKGPSIPITEEQMHKAFLSQLSELRNEQTHKQKTTEVDRWLSALQEERDVLPRHADIFGVQEALFNTGFRLIGDVDELDPGVRGTYGHEESQEERRRVISRQLEMLNVPGEWEMHCALADAVIKRNDAMNDARGPTETWGADGMDGFMGMGMDDPMNIDPDSVVIKVGGIESDKWDEPKLVKLRVGLYRSCRKYRKAKAKFDRAVSRCILMEDVKHCHDKILPLRNVLKTLRETWNTPEGETPEWKGILSPVKKPFTGKHAAKLEVIYFVYMVYIRSFLCITGSIACAALSVAILISESSMSVLLGAGKYSTSERGSLLLDMVCERAAVPPQCTQEYEQRILNDAETLVYSDVQWVVILHLFYMITVCYWALLRVRLFGIYEVVPGETDSFSLLFNAYAACRLAPSIVQNYLGMLHESHEDHVDGEKLTVFEETFSRIGRIPFIGSSFNEVLPPIMFTVSMLTLAAAVGRSCGCKLPRFDGEEHKTADRIEQAKEIIALERRRYQTMRSQTTNIRTRMQLYPEMMSKDVSNMESDTVMSKAVAVHKAARRFGKKAAGGVREAAGGVKDGVWNFAETIGDTTKNRRLRLSRSGGVGESGSTLDERDDSAGAGSGSGSIPPSPSASLTPMPGTINGNRTASLSQWDAVQQSPRARIGRVKSSRGGGGGGDDDDDDRTVRVNVADIVSSPTHAQTPGGGVVRAMLKTPKSKGRSPRHPPIPIGRNGGKGLALFDELGSDGEQDADVAATPKQATPSLEWNWSGKGVSAKRIGRTPASASAPAFTARQLPTTSAQLNRYALFKDGDALPPVPKEDQDQQESREQHPERDTQHEDQDQKGL